MGACNCVNRPTSNDELNIDVDRLKTLSIEYIKIAVRIKEHPKIFATLVRVQARLRGLISRQKVRSMNQAQILPNRHDYGNYHLAPAQSRIVILLI